MTYQVYLPCDSAALALGADEVCDALRREAERRGVALEIVRNGSRGMFWLEPLLEVVTPAGRVAYGPVAEQDVCALFDAGFYEGKAHPLLQGLTEQIPYLRHQERLTFARMGITDPLSLGDYEAHEGFAGLRRALTLGASGIVGEVLHSGGQILLPNMTILQVLAGAGFTQFSNTKGIYVLRNDGGKQSKLPFNYKAALKGDSDVNFVLKPGDTVVVP